MRHSLFRALTSTLLGGMLLASACSGAATSPTPVTPAVAPPTLTPPTVGLFKRIFIIVFENKSRETVLANPYFRGLGERGVQLTNYLGVSHPSQPNYFALTAGDPLVSDDGVYDRPERNLVDLLEAAGVTWKAYLETYPGGCYAGDKAGAAGSGVYQRKHNPFISFDSVRSDPQRCGRIVNADQLEADVAARQLPSVSFYVPNSWNNTHDKSLQYGADWLSGFLEPKLEDPAFAENTLIFITFDEVDGHEPAATPVYAVLLGPLVRAGTQDTARYDHYSLLRTIEANFDLGSLGRNDARATPFSPCNYRGACAP